MPLPAPSTSFGGVSSAASFNPMKRRTGTGGSGGGYNSRYRTLPLQEILAQRERTPTARYANGQPVPEGMRINVPGFNTSGVGPGTRGFRGSYMGGGYNFGEGTRRPSARTADEFYAQRDKVSGNPLDNLEFGNSNLMKSFLQNAMAEARGLTGTGPQAGRGEAWRSNNPGNATNAADAAVWRQAQSFGGSNIGPSASGAGMQPEIDPQEPDAMEIQQMIADARRQETQDMLAARANQDPSMSFFGGEGTTPGATIEGMPADLYFQYKAAETGQGNRFAGDPYAGGDTDEAWRYSQRLAPFLKKLGIGQPFPSRRPL